VVLDQWREFLVVARSTAKPDMDEDALDMMRRVHLRHPQPPLLMRYALAAGLNGRPAEAQRALATLCRIHVPQRCEEGRDAWNAARAKYPQLGSMSEMTWH
jgi:hypothetical protein